METKALDKTELVNQIIDVIVKEGMIDREQGHSGRDDRKP